MKGATTAFMATLTRPYARFQDRSRSTSECFKYQIVFSEWPKSDGQTLGCENRHKLVNCPTDFCDVLRYLFKRKPIKSRSNASSISTFRSVLEQARPSLEMACMHGRGGCRHARFGRQPTRCPIPGLQGPLLASAVCGISIDPTEQSRRLL
jgi:hypothetical protein